MGDNMGGGGGKKTKKTFQVAVSTSTITDDDLVKKTIVSSALSKMKKGDQPLTELASQFLSGGHVPLNNFYNRCSTDSIDAMPTTRLLQTAIKDGYMQSKLATYHNIDEEDVHIVYEDYGIIPDMDYTITVLQRLYQLKANTSSLLYSNAYYKFLGIDYDFDSRTVFRCKLEPYPEITTLIRKRVEVEVFSQEDLLYETLPEGKELKLTSTTLITTIYGKYEDTNAIVSEQYGDTVEVEEYVDINTTVPSITYTEMSSTTTTQSVSSTSIDIPRYSYRLGFSSKYYLSSSPYDLLYFFYLPDLGTVPEIGQVNDPTWYTPESVNAPVDSFPVLALRDTFFSVDEYNGTTKSIDAGDGSWTVGKPTSYTEERYNKTSQILKSVNMELDDLLDAIGANPDIDTIMDAVLMVGVTPDNTAPIVSKVIYETLKYFDEIGDLTTKRGGSYLYEEQPYNSAFRWSSFYRTVLSGSIGTVGTCTHSVTTSTSSALGSISEYHVIERNIETSSGYWGRGTWIAYKEYILGTRMVTRRVENSSGESSFITVEETVYQDIISQTPTVSTPTGEYSIVKTLLNSSDAEGNFIVARKQLTIDTYEEIEIGGIESGTVIGTKPLNLDAPDPVNSVFSKQSTPSLGSTTKEDWADPFDNYFIIPLCRKVFDKLSSLDKIDLYEHGFRLVFYAAVLHITKLKWYETGIFKALTTLIVVIISIITWQYYLVPAWLAMATIALAIIGPPLLAMIDDPWIRAAVQALIIVVMAIAGNLAGAAQTTAQTIIITAVNLIQLSTLAISAYTETAMEKLQESQKDFSKDYEDKQEELEEASGLLEPFLDTEIITDITHNAGILLLSNPQYYYTTALEMPYAYDMLFKGNYNMLIDKYYEDRLDINNPIA